MNHILGKNMMNLFSKTFLLFFVELEITTVSQLEIDNVTVFVVELITLRKGGLRFCVFSTEQDPVR